MKTTLNFITLYMDYYSYIEFSTWTIGMILLIASFALSLYWDKIKPVLTKIYFNIF